MANKKDADKPMQVDKPLDKSGKERPTDTNGYPVFPSGMEGLPQGNDS